MNIKFTFRFLLLMLKSSSQEGFTLLELMVVMLFISILSLIALPNFIKQAGKAREVEFKNVVGTINRSQQVYHWEKGVFADGTTEDETLRRLNVTFANKYIDEYDILAYPDYSTVAPVNNDIETDQTRAYSGGTFYSAGFYATIICQSIEVAASVSPPLSATSCNTDADELK